MPVGSALDKLSASQRVDVRMPDGSIIRGVPRNAKKADIERAWKKARAAGAIRDKRDTSFVQGVVEGVQKPATNAYRMLSKFNPLLAAADAVGFGPQQAADAADKALEAKFSSSDKRGSALGRIAGGIIGTAPTMALPGAGLLGAIGQGAAAGGLMSQDINDPKQVAKDVAIGAGSGAVGYGVGSAVTKGAGRLIGGRKAMPPKVAKNPADAAYRKATQTLSDEGVLMSPGRRAGGFTRRMEDAADTLPISPTRGAKEASLIDFQRGAYNQVLKPIGIKLNQNVQPGRDAIVALDDTVNAAYNKAASRLSLNLDDTLANKIDSYRADALAKMGPDNVQQLNANLDNIVSWRGGQLQGKQVSQALSDIRGVASSARREGKQALADTLWSVHDDLESAAMKQSSAGAVKSFRSARESMRRMHTLDKAVAKGKDGMFTPNQFKTAAHSKGYGVTDKRLARGEAPMQDYADAAALVLPDALGNSGTAERSAMLSLMSGGGLFGTAGALGVPLPAAAAMAAPSAAYVPAVNRFMQYGRNLSPGRVNYGRALTANAPRVGRVADLSAVALGWPYASD